MTDYKYLVVENDDKLPEDLERLMINISDEPERLVITKASNVDSDVFIDAFKNAEILVFKPTQITFSQYNLMLMIMYKLAVTQCLGIKEVYVFTTDEGSMEYKLRDLWKGKRKYLDLVLKYVSIYTVNNRRKIQIDLS